MLFFIKNMEGTYRTVSDNRATKPPKQNKIKGVFFLLFSAYFFIFSICTFFGIDFLTPLIASLFPSLSLQHHYLPKDGVSCDGDVCKTDVNTYDGGKEACDIFSITASSTKSGIIPLMVLLPLSSVPLLVWMMVKYVSLRLYLRN